MPVFHQGAILKLPEFKPLDDTSLLWLEGGLKRHVKRRVETRKLFFIALQLLHEKKISLPSYHLLSELISKHYFDYEENLLAIVKLHSTPDQKEKLRTLLEANKKDHHGKLKEPALFQINY